MYLVIDVKDNDFYNVMSVVMKKVKIALFSNVDGYDEYIKGYKKDEEGIKSRLKSLIASEKFRKMIITMISLETISGNLEHLIPRVEVGINYFDYCKERMEDDNVGNDNSKLFPRIEHLQNYFNRNIEIKYEDSMKDYEPDNSELYYIDIIDGSFGCM